jgi:tetratricopeptide (TPR) repeat protein
VFDQLKQPESARASLQTALRLDPHLKEARALLGYIEGELEARRLNSKPMLQLARGIENVEHEEFEAALKELKSARADLPENASIHYYLGVVYDELERPVEAITSFQAALQLNPDLQDAWDYLKVLEAGPMQEFEASRAKQHLDDACEYVDNGQPEKALKECELAKKDLPQVAIAWNYLGLVYQGCGKLEPAIKAYLKATRMNPRFYPARTNLANARVRLEEEQYRLIAERGETQAKEMIDPAFDISKLPAYTENDGLAPQWLYLPEPSFLIKGFAGHRNRQGRIGLDPLDTDFEGARIEGTIIRKLIITGFQWQKCLLPFR